jgi:hypothetical protein
MKPNLLVDGINARLTSYAILGIHTTDCEYSVSTEMMDRHNMSILKGNFAVASLDVART